MLPGADQIHEFEVYCLGILFARHAHGVFWAHIPSCPPSLKGDSSKLFVH